MLLGGLLKGKKDEGREIFISRGEEKTTCELEMKREGEQIDRKSLCDSKQSQITLVCLSWHIIMWISRHNSPPIPPSSRTR